MIPRECDNDYCDYNDEGEWEHVDECDGPPPPLSREEWEERIRNAPPTSFLATMGAALLGTVSEVPDVKQTQGDESHSDS